MAYYNTSGELVEDLHDDFLFTVESTISPVPVVVSEVTSPSAVAAAVDNQLLTHVRVDWCALSLRNPHVL